MTGIITDTVNYEQIVNSPSLYVNGFQIVNNGTLNFTITNGIARDTTNAVDIIINNSSGLTTVSGSYVGINGLDNGTIAATTWYYVFAIANPLNPLQTGFIISLNSSPILPYNYTVYRRIGWIYSGATTVFDKFWQTGNGVLKNYMWDTPHDILTGATNVTVFTTVDVMTAPPNPSVVYINVNFTPSVLPPADFLSIRPKGSSAGAGVCPLIIRGITQDIPQYEDNLGINLVVPPGETFLQLDYIMTNSGDIAYVDCYGFDDYL